MDSTSKPWTPTDTGRCLERLDKYKDTVVRLFPVLPRRYVAAWSITDADALALSYFLECYPREVVVLDIGTFIGASAFHLASQPKVSEVISVDPNPPIADEINDKSNTLGTTIDPEPLRNLRVLDVARAALAEFGEERKKTQFCEGVVGSVQVGVEGGSLGDLEKVEVPALESSEEVSLIAFVDGLHTKEGVREDLKAIFARDPHAIALLDDCRHVWGPFVQAGVVSFMETATQKYHFQLFGDLNPSLATSTLGIVYPDIEAAETRRTLAMFSEMFSRRLDPLRLLRREEELIGTINAMDDRLKQLRRQLRRNNRVLANYSSRRRYRFVDAIARGAFRIPLISKLRREKVALSAD